MSKSSMTDNGSLVEPDCFSFRKLDDCTWQQFASEMVELWRGQVEFVRFTVINPESPNPPYPHGWYFEGWAKHPRGREAEFNHPLAALNESTDQ